MKEDKLKRLPTGGMKFKGKEFKGIEIPRSSTRKGKAQMVLTQKGKELKIVHFGTQFNSSPKDINKIKAGRKGYLSKSKQIRNKEGFLTKNDKFSPNYWSSNNES